MAMDFVIKVLFGLLRTALTPVVIWLNDRGIVTTDETLQTLLVVISLVVSLGWSWANKWLAERKLNTTIALANQLTGSKVPNLTASDIEAVIRRGDAAPASTPKNLPPRIQGTGDGIATIKRLTGTGLVLVVVLGSSFSLSGCAAAAFVATAPLPNDAATVRLVSAQVATSLEAGFQTLDAVGAQLDQIPGLTTGQRNAYDCALLRVVGTRAEPSAAVTSACGALPLRPSAPLRVAADRARAATSCASLRSTLVAFEPELNRAFAALEAATNPVVRLSLAILRSQFALVTSGGLQCQ